MRNYLIIGLSVVYTLITLGVISWVNVFFLPVETSNMYEHDIENCLTLRLAYRRNFIGQERLVGVWCNEPSSSASPYSK